jgi:hypothetical protein
MATIGSNPPASSFPQLKSSLADKKSFSKKAKSSIRKSLFAKQVTIIDDDSSRPTSAMPLTTQPLFEPKSLKEIPPLMRKSKTISNLSSINMVSDESARIRGSSFSSLPTTGSVDDSKNARRIQPYKMPQKKLTTKAISAELENIANNLKHNPKDYEILVVGKEKFTSNLTANLLIQLNYSVIWLANGNYIEWFRF